MRIWIDVESAAGVRQGDGPILSATGWTHTRRLDKAGTFAFSMAALDPRADLVRLKRVVRCWAIVSGRITELGAGIIESIKARVSADGVPLLDVAGDDLLRELTTRTVGSLSLTETAITHPAYAHYIDYEYSHDHTPDPMVLLNDGQVGDSSTHDEMIISEWRYLYLFDPQPFNVLRVGLGPTVNIYNTVLEISYWNGTGWQSVSALVDGTATDTVAFAQSGDISWAYPNDWVPESDFSLYAVRIRAGSGSTIMFDIADIALVRTQPTANVLDPIMALAPETWSLDAVHGYTSISSATELGADLVSNGDFMAYTGDDDDGVSDTFDDWTNSGVDDGAGNKIELTALTTPDSGAREAVKITRTTATPYLYQDVTVEEAGDYRLTWWTRGDGTRISRVQVEDRSHTSASIAQYITPPVDGVATTTWTQMTYDFTTPAGCTSVRVALHGPAAAGAVWFDLVSLQKHLGGGKIYMVMNGESVLETLTRVAEQTREHFILSPTGRRVLWLRDDARDSHLTAMGGNPSGRQIADDLLLVQQLEESQSGYDLATRVYCYGGMAGTGRLTLAQTSRTPPTGYVINHTESYISNTAAEAALGRIDRIEEFTEIKPSQPGAENLRHAANALFERGLGWLSSHTAMDTDRVAGDVPKAYTLSLVGCRRIILPGYKLRLLYRQQAAGYVTLDIDASLWILASTLRVDAEGLQTVALEVATVPALPESETDLILGEIRNGRAARAR